MPDPIEATDTQNSPTAGDRRPVSGSASRDDLGVAYLTPKLFMLVMSAVLIAREKGESIQIGYMIMAAVWCWLVARHLVRLAQKQNDLRSDGEPQSSK